MTLKVSYEKMNCELSIKKLQHAQQLLYSLGYSSVLEDIKDDINDVAYFIRHINEILSQMERDREEITAEYY
jgi:hypothetical protein